jgi:hypothetical protein
MLELNFSTVLAHDHAMLLVFVVPHVRDNPRLGVAFLWEETGKKRAFAVCENLICVVVARYDAWWSCRGCARGAAGAGDVGSSAATANGSPDTRVVLLVPAGNICGFRPAPWILERF